MRFSHAAAIPQFAVSLCIAAAVPACAPPAHLTATEDLSALQAAVTGQAAAALSAQGTFLLAAPSDMERPLLSEETARAVAEFAARRLGPWVGPTLEEEHQGPIDFARLRTCGPSYFALSAFESIPGDLPDPAVYHVGPRWLVAACTPSGRP
jgi:hypothetical protein